MSPSPHPPSLRPSSSSPRILPGPHLCAFPSTVPSAWDTLPRAPALPTVLPTVHWPLPAGHPGPDPVPRRHCSSIVSRTLSPVSSPSPDQCPTLPAQVRAPLLHRPWGCTREARGAKSLSRGRKTSCNVTSYPWLPSSEHPPLTPFLAQGVHPARPPQRTDCQHPLCRSPARPFPPATGSGGRCLQGISAEAWGGGGKAGGGVPEAWGRVLADARPPSRVCMAVSYCLGPVLRVPTAGPGGPVPTGTPRTSAPSPSLHYRVK